MDSKGNGSSHDQVREMPADHPVSPGILVETLRRHPLMILFTGMLALVGAYFLLERVTPLYTSTARIYVEQEIPKVIHDSERGVMTKQDNYLFTQAEVLRSTPVLTNAVGSLDTQQMQTFADVSDPVSVLHAGLETAVGKMDGIINISFKAPHPAEAAEITNAVVEAYVAFLVEQKRDAATALVSILEEARGNYDADVTQKYQRLLEFKRQNESLALGSDQADNVALRRMEQLLAQLSEAKVTTQQVKHFYDTAVSLAEDPAGLRQLLEARRGRRIDDTVTNKMASLHAELTRLKDDKADVLLQLKPGHPAVATLDGEIKRVQEEIGELDRQFVQSQLAILRQEYVAAQQREEELARQCEEQRQQVQRVNDELTEYARLQSDYDEAKESSGVLEDRIKELSVTEGVGKLTVTILERALAASTPSEPRKNRFMAIALLLGLCGGTGLGLVRELLDQRLRSSEEASTLLRLPVLGVIPSIRSPMRSGTLRAQMVRICPMGPEAEAFRRLRTPLLLGTFNGHAKTILVTSPACGEGKTTVTSNLALALAQAGQRVLILDADCHTPRQHRIFKRSRRRNGLSSVIAGQVSVDDAIEPTGIDGLDLLTCGSEACNPSEMFNDDRFRELIATLAGKYDRVLIDSPPILQFADAQILAAQSDGVILVLRMGASTRRDSLHAYGELVGIGAHVLGAVINGVPRRHRSYRYNGYYPHRHPIEAIPAVGRGSKDKSVLPSERLLGRRT